MVSGPRLDHRDSLPNGTLIGLIGFSVEDERLTIIGAVSVDEQTLYPSRRKIAVLLLMSIGFVCVGLWVIPSAGWRGWLSVIFFGLCSLVFGATLLPRAAYLRLHGQGFEMCTLFRTAHFEWSDIGDIGVTRVGLNKMVAFNFTDHYSGQRRARVVSRGISGWEGALPDTYGMSPTALAALLSAYRNRAMEAAQQSNEADTPGGPQAPL